MINAAMVLMMLERKLAVRAVARGMIAVGIMERDEFQERDIALFSLMLLVVAPELREVHPIVAPSEIQRHEGD